MKTKRIKAAVGCAAPQTFAVRKADGADGITLYALPVLPAASPAVPSDGRKPVHFEAQVFVDAFNGKGRRVPVDVGHMTEWSGSMPAIGFVHELFIESDGSVWAWCELNADGIELLEGKKFGFTSPTLVGFEADDGWHALRLKSLAVTNNPALEMSSNFTAEGDEEAEETEDTPAPEANAPEGETATPSDGATPPVDPTKPAQGTDTPAEPAEGASAAAEGAATTAALTAAPAADVVALTAARDEALTRVVTLSEQVQSLTQQLQSVTAERDTLAKAATDKAAADAVAAVSAVLDRFTASGHATPAEREDLAEVGKSLGVEKLTAMLAKRSPLAVLSASAGGQGAPAAASVPPGIAEYLTRQGLPLEAYQRGAASGSADLATRDIN